MNAQNILVACDQIAEKTRDAEIAGVNSWMKQSLQGEHKPTLALVSFNSNHAEHFEWLQTFAGIELPETFASMIRDEPACVILDYCQVPVVLSEEDSDILVLGLPCDYLRARRVAVCDEVYEAERWFELSSEIDIACLCINATMAMNQMERDWLASCAKPWFCQDEVAVALTHLDAVKRASDVKDLRDSVDAALKRLELSIHIADDPQAALGWMHEALNGAHVRENHDRRVAGNGIAAIIARLKALTHAASIDEGTILNTIGQLQSQSGWLEMAGEMASDSVVYNAIQQLKAQCSDGIRAYGSQMSDSICQKLASASLDELKTMEAKVNRYVKAVWEQYFDNFEKKLNGELENVAASLTRQMELDAGKLISNLDEEACRTLYAAIENPALVDFGMPNVSGVFSSSKTEEITERLRRETRNLMILSIPMTIICPPLGIGHLLVTIALNAQRSKDQLEAIRADMSGIVRDACRSTSNSIVRETGQRFDEGMKEIQANVKAAYGGLIRKIEEKLNALKAQQLENAQMRHYMEEQAEKVLPDLVAAL